MDRNLYKLNNFNFRIPFRSGKGILLIHADALLKIIFVLPIKFYPEDCVCKEVSVAVNDVESRIVFVDHRHGEMSVR